jgi:hypothetical protein
MGRMIRAAAPALKPAYLLLQDRPHRAFKRPLSFVSFAVVLLSLLILGGAADAQFNAEIGGEISPIFAERAPFVREALFSRNGRAATVIAYPSRQPEARVLAERIASALREKFGIDADIRSSADIAEEDYREQTVIHLGNIFTNPELLWFYLHGFTFADASWPGADGWAIQQVHDPKGYGRNVLIIAASSATGLQAGVARFAGEIDRLERPAWTEFILVESETPPVAGDPARVSTAQIAELEKEYLEAMRGGALRTTAEQALWDAGYYVMSGNENYLAALRACVPAHLQFLREGGNQQAEAIYFWFFKYAQIWDAVEHSHYWDEEFRSTMVNLLYWLSEVVVSLGHFEKSLNPYPKNNHETYAAVSLLFSALYFQKYYDLERADHWRHLADQVLATQSRFSRTMDESRHYYEHSAMHALFYAIATGDRTFIDSGNAAEFADLLMMLIDNTGENPNFGDGRQYDNNRTFYYLLPFASVSGDPRYLGLSNLTRGYVENPQSIWEQGPRGHGHSLNHYIPPVTPEVLPVPPGVRAFRLDQALYEREREDPVFPHLPPPDVWVPSSKTFDKLVFRNGYDRANQYLLLDGYGRGIHSHRDANVITRFTDNNRIWLVDDTYFRNSAAYHNGLMVIRNGTGGFSPPFSSLDTAATLDRTGFSRTTVPGFNGIDWTRNIFWVREDVFVVIDEALARETGEYTLQTFWRSLGEMTGDDRRVQLDQEGESFALSFPASVGVRSTADIGNTQDQATWANYPFARPLVKRTMAYLTPVLEPGDLRSFQAVLYTFPTDEPRVIECRSFSETALLTREDGEPRLYFSSGEALPEFLQTDARMGIVTPSLISLTGVTQLFIHDRQLLDESSPVSCEIDLEQNVIVVIAQGDALVTQLNISGEQHAQEQRKLPLPGGARLAMELGGALEHLWHTTPVRQRADREIVAPFLDSIFRRDFEDLSIHAAVIVEVGDDHGPHFILATDGGVESWSSHGESALWSYPTSAPVHAVTVADFGDGPAIVFGTVRGQIVALDPDGSERWTYQIQRRRGSIYGSGARVFSVSAGDTDQDGRDEILVTTSSWMSYLINPDGRLIWGEPVARNSLISSAFADLNGDGNRELLIGSENFRMHAFTPDYRVLWSFRSKRGTIDRIHSADITGDGADEVLIGSSDGHIYAVKTCIEEMVPTSYHPRDAALTPIDILFEHDTGGDVLAIATGDLDDDGSRKILVGSDSFFLYRFGADGTREAMLNAGDMVRHLVVFEGAPAPYRIAAGLANGRVLLLDAGLAPSAVADIGSEILGIRYDPETNLLHVAGRSSFGVFSLD